MYCQLLDGHPFSVAFLTSNCMKEAFSKQKLNAGTFLHNQWRKVGYANKTIHAAQWLNRD